jgi:hypothetical protein
MPLCGMLAIFVSTSTTYPDVSIHEILYGVLHLGYSAYQGPVCTPRQRSCTPTAELAYLQAALTDFLVVSVAHIKRRKLASELALM